MCYLRPYLRLRSRLLQALTDGAFPAEVLICCKAWIPVPRSEYDGLTDLLVINGVHLNSGNGLTTKEGTHLEPLNHNMGRGSTKQLSLA
jgi:hypothetical protein